MVLISLMTSGCRLPSFQFMQRFDTVGTNESINLMVIYDQRSVLIKFELKILMRDNYDDNSKINNFL